MSTFYAEVIKEYKYTETCHFHNTCVAIDDKYLIFICNYKKSPVYLVYEIASTGKLNNFSPEVIIELNNVATYTWCTNMRKLKVYNFETNFILDKTDLFNSSCNQTKEPFTHITFNMYCSILTTKLKLVEISDIIN